MKRVILVGVGALAVTAGVVFAQTPAGSFDKALSAAPPNMRAGAMVIKWHPDGTYDTLRPGTNTMMCYDQSGESAEQPFSVQCTSTANLERVKQNKIYEAKFPERAAREAALTELEKNGQRVKPQFGSIFYTRQGKDEASANPRPHVTVAVPGATAESLGLPSNNKQGGAWIMAGGTSAAHIMMP